VCVTKDIQTGEVKVWKRPDEQNQEELREYLSKYILVGHNAIWFDTPVLNRLCKTQIDPERVIDTLVVSRLVNSWDYNRHGLADWGERLNLPKGDFFDFSRLSQEMIDYCIRDVEVTEKVFNFLKSTILDPRWKDSMRNEHRAAIISTEMHYNGFPFDVKKAEELYKQIEEERRLLNLEIQEAFPPKSVLLREINPIPTKTGKIHSKDFRWLDGLPEDNGYIVDSPFSLFEFEPFNPSSTKQCIERLNEFGWKPTEKTKGHIKAERDRDYEKLEAYKKTGWTISEENLNTLPPSAPPAAHKLVRYILLSRRLTTLNEWLAAYNPKTQCIHGEIKPIGTWTHRAAHKNPNTGNIIRIQNDPETKEVLWGEKGGWGADYRSLWTVKPGWKLVGCDAEGIQLRVLAHYMEDEEFTQALVSGSSKDETDVHSLNRKKLNNSKTICKTRNDAKTFS